MDFARVPRRRLDRLKPSQVDGLLLELRAKKLSDSTVRQVFTVLGIALEDAVRDGLIARNPVKAVQRPSVPHVEACHLSPAEVAALLEAAETSHFRPLLALIAATGLRRGEAGALSWSDVDWIHSTLRVRGTLTRIDGELKVTEPKTAKSRRTLPLSPGAIALLKAHRARQREERIRAGRVWQGSQYVFTTELGGPVDPRNVLRAFRTAAVKAGTPAAATVHTLRHSAATTWLENGTNIKAVSELLGHSSISITGDVYGHVTEETARQAMDVLADAIGL